MADQIKSPHRHSRAGRHPRQRQGGGGHDDRGGGASPEPGYARNGSCEVVLDDTTTTVAAVRAGSGVGSGDRKIIGEGRYSGIRATTPWSTSRFPATRCRRRIVEGSQPRAAGGEGGESNQQPFSKEASSWHPYSLQPYRLTASVAGDAFVHGTGQLTGAARQRRDDRRRLTHLPQRHAVRGAAEIRATPCPRRSRPATLDGQGWPQLAGTVSLGYVATRGGEPTELMSFSGIITVEYDSETDKSTLSIAG